MQMESGSLVMHPCNDIYEETISLIDQNKYEIPSCGTQYQNVY